MDTKLNFDRVTSEEGWCGMYNDKKYGMKHQYYHLSMEIMSCMNVVHLDCPEMTKEYMTRHKPQGQGVMFDMEMNASAKTMATYTDVLMDFDHLEDVGLIFYENNNLNLQIFNKFLAALSKQKRLRRLHINLRWCQQVTDEWMENLAKALPECLESLEIWVMGCHRLTNIGLGHMMENLGRCSNLENLQVFAEGTGLTNEHQEHFERFVVERSIKYVRMVGLGKGHD